MSKSQKRLLLVGAPIVSIVILMLLFGGDRSNRSPEFEGIDDLSATATEVDDRYEISAKPHPELDLPPVKLDFLENELSFAESIPQTGLPSQPNATQSISAATETNELEEEVQSSQELESEVEIPLSPPVRSPTLSEGAVQETVSMVTFENESGNDFPLIPPTGIDSSADDRGDAVEFLVPLQDAAPNQDPTPDQGSTSDQDPTSTEIQSAEPLSGKISVTTEIPQVVPTASTVQDGGVEAKEHVPPAQQIKVNDSRQEDRSDQLILAKSTTLPPAISTQIRQRLDYGTSLARRGAFASAEEIYFQVIRLIAETKDSQLGERQHTIRLADGLTALEEADDFVTSDLRTRVRINVENIIQGHNSTVLQNEDVSDMTSIQALQRYYEYAGELIASACDSEPVGSEALYFLGKLYATDSQYDPSSSAMRNAKSMIMHQSALEANAMNHRAANELGVLLAQYGRFDDAKEMLIHCVSTFPEPIAWKNLAVVHEKLGELKLAGLAFKESKIAVAEAAQRGTAETSGPIQWVDAESFVRAAGDRHDFVDSAKAGSSADKQQKAVAQDSNSSAARSAKASPEWWKIWKR